MLSLPGLWMRNSVSEDTCKGQHSALLLRQTTDLGTFAFHHEPNLWDLISFIYAKKKIVKPTLKQEIAGQQTGVEESWLTVKGV